MEKKFSFQCRKKNEALTAEKKYSNYDLDNIFSFLCGPRDTQTNILRNTCFSVTNFTADE